MPDSSDNYQLPSWPPTAINRDLWNAVMGSIGQRLLAREELEADFEALIAQGTQASLDYIQATVAPQIASLQTSIELAQEQIDQIIVDGIAPNAAKLGGQLPAYYAPASALPLKADVTYVDSELLDLATAIQLLLDQKAGATETANALSKRTRVDEAQALTQAERGQARANIGADVLGGFRNKIINGGFEIAQRGTPFNTTGSTPKYTLDRWLVACTTGLSCIALRQENPAGSIVGPYRGQFAFTGTGPANSYVSTRIEGVETITGKATLSFYAADSAATSVSLQIIQHFGTGGSAAVETALGSVAIDGNLFSTKRSVLIDIPSLVGKTIGPNNYLEVRFYTTIPDAHQFYLARVSLVEGDATAEDDPFSPRHIQQELALCQRYTRPIQGIMNGYGVTGQFVGHSVQIPPMRTTPTVTQKTDPTASNCASIVINPTNINTVEFTANVIASGAYKFDTRANLDAEL